MSEVGSWIVRLEAELARELGQPVTAAAGGEAPDPAQSLVCFLNLPGARVTLAADAQGIGRLLVEGRVIEPDSVDQGLVQELWTGILGSVAARMGGTATTEGSPRSFPTHPCRLQLGETAVRMALDLEAMADREGETAREATRETSRETSREAGRETTRETGRETGRESPPARTAEKDGRGRYELLLEVELEAVVRFGSRSLELRDLLELGPGDVVEMDRQVSDPVDLIVGDRIVARGEVVLVDGNFGLRVTEVAEPVCRLESIPCLG